MKDVRTMLNDFVGGLGKLGETNEAHVQAFMNLLGTNYAEGALSVKTKELISVAIGAYNRCEYCIVYHVYKAYEAGATREDVYKRQGWGYPIRTSRHCEYVIISVEGNKTE